MQNTWLVLLPPLIVVLCAALIRHVRWSLVVGIISALMIAYDFSVTKVVPEFFYKIWATTELGKIKSWQAVKHLDFAFICLFLVVLGVIIAALQFSGGAYAYGNVVSKRLKNARQAESSSIILSFFFFIDDYFSCLIVGSVMRLITDRFKVPRVKLALLANSMAAPLAVLLPISSWAAYIILQIGQAGVGTSSSTGVTVIGDPFYVYMNMIPFFFYSVITIFSLWFIVLRRVSYGVLCTHEEIAQKTGNLFGGKTPETKKVDTISDDTIAQSSLWDFIVPIGSLFLVVMLMILYTGDWCFFGGKNSLLLALQNANSSISLFIGSFTALIITFSFLFARQKINLIQIVHVCREGVMILGPSAITLILIKTFSNLLRFDLATGNYLAQVLIGHVSIVFLPAIFFLVAVLTATMIGSAWGAIGIYVPIAIPLLISLSHVQTPVSLAALPALFPLLGALISGAVVGNHLSPMSDTMLMASTGTGANHMDVIKTQYSFTWPCVFATAIAFLIAGLLVGACSLKLNILISLIIGLILNMLVLSFLNMRKQKK
ncbi:MAG: Na+/H+ antiporter NhaC family protein [bacterium]